MKMKQKPIQTEITCPKCQTKIDVAGIKDAIYARIEKAVLEAMKTI